MAMNMFVPITKVDVERREVWGVAAEEAPDRSGEIFDYATSTPLFRAWNDEFAKATDGASLGNVRAMHQPVAAGKIIQIDYDDAAKVIAIGTKIVDDAEWRKCEEGVYTGFSIGGDYVKRWNDPQNPGLKRYTGKPSEVSLVDNPAMPGARFTMVKGDGLSEEREFAKSDAAAAQEEAVEDAFFAGLDISDVAGVVDMLGRAAARYASEPEIASKFSEAAKVVSEALAAKQAQLDDALAEAQAAAHPQPLPGGGENTLEMSERIGELVKMLAEPRVPPEVTAALAPLAEMRGELEGLKKAVSDMAARLGAQGEQMNKAASGPGFGPVLREIPLENSSGPQSQVAAVFDELEKGIDDPTLKQEVQKQRAAMLIKMVHAGGGKAISR